jgi:hypothetical protein
MTSGCAAGPDSKGGPIQLRGAVRNELLHATRGDRLPPWNEWFSPDVLSELLPEADMRGRFVNELPKLPVAYFEEPAPSVDAWPPPHCGYLRLSEGYESRLTLPNNATGSHAV